MNKFPESLYSSFIVNRIEKISWFLFEISAALRRAFSQNWSTIMSISCLFLLLLYPFNLVFVEAINIEPKEIALDGGKWCF